MAQEASHAVTVDALRSLAVFSDLPSSALDQLLRGSQVRHLDRQQRLSSLERSQGENYCFVLSGVVAIALDREGRTVPARSLDDRSFEHIGFFAPGELFSDGFLDCRPAWESRCSTAWPPPRPLCWPPAAQPWRHSWPGTRPGPRGSDNRWQLPETTSQPAGTHAASGARLLPPPWVCIQLAGAVSPA